MSSVILPYKRESVITAVKRRQVLPLFFRFLGMIFDFLVAVGVSASVSAVTECDFLISVDVILALERR